MVVEGVIQGLQITVCPVNIFASRTKSWFIISTLIHKKKDKENQNLCEETDLSGLHRSVVLKVVEESR